MKFRFKEITVESDFVSALNGAVLLILADVTGRILGRPGELEAGIVTAFVGAPVFIAVVQKARGSR